MSQRKLWHPNTTTEKELSNIERLVEVALIAASALVSILFLGLISRIL